MSLIDGDDLPSDGYFRSIALTYTLPTSIQGVDVPKLRGVVRWANMLGSRVSAEALPRPRFLYMRCS